MLEALELMKWPLLACLLLPGLLVYLGLHIVRREIIFVDLALAQVAALGTCFGILMHYEPSSWESYSLSLLFTLVGAGIFTLTRTHSHRVPQEALIGIVYVVTAALGILLLSRSPEGNEELRRTLIGDVLLVTPTQVLRTFGLYLGIAVVHFLCRRKFLAISFDPDGAEAAGLSVHGWDFLFYAMFGWVVTSFVQIGGVLLVFSFLIVPAVCANFLAERLGPRLVIGWITATIASVAGLAISYLLDLPTGAAIVCTLGAALILTMLAARFRGPIIT
jgi:zinc/manganese transport system permease protein